MNFYALIPAAGSGSRMGGKMEKQYQPLNSVPMIAHALIVLAREPRISKLFVVLSPTDKRWGNYELGGSPAGASLRWCHACRNRVERLGGDGGILCGGRLGAGARRGAPLLAG
jgi:CTP:molybdopterin cytidylyltransferase MocA